MQPGVSSSYTAPQQSHLRLGAPSAGYYDNAAVRGIGIQNRNVQGALALLIPTHSIRVVLRRGRSSAASEHEAGDDEAADEGDRALEAAGEGRSAVGLGRRAAGRSGAGRRRGAVAGGGCAGGGRAGSGGSRGARRRGRGARRGDGRALRSRRGAGSSS